MSPVKVFEPRFGYDLSQVRVHTDAKAAEAARVVNALAYTVGSDMVFGTGQYAPQKTEGRRLIAHELTHVVQQSHSAPTTTNLMRKESPRPTKQPVKEFVWTPHTSVL